MKARTFVFAALLAVATVAQDASAQCCRFFCCGRRAACRQRSAASFQASGGFRSRYARASTCSACVPGSTCFDGTCSTGGEFAPGLSSYGSGYCATGSCYGGACSTVVAPCDQVETTETTTEETTVETQETPTPVCNPCERVETTCSGGYCSTSAASTYWTTQRSRGGGLLAGLLDIANATRARFGLGGYVLDEQLCREAEATARYCASIGGLQHRSGGAGSCEIIAYNYSGFSGAVDQWLGSRAGHREALLSRGYTRAGVAIVNAGGRSYCCMRFR